MNPTDLTPLERQIAAALEDTARRTFADGATPGPHPGLTRRAPDPTPWRRYLPPLIAAAAVIAVAIPLTVVSSRPGRSSRPTATLAPANSHAPSKPSVSPPVTSAAAGTPIIPQVAAQILISLLPRPGKTSELSGQYMSDFAAAQFTYDDDHGAAGLSIAIGTGQAFVCTEQASTPGCRTLPNGDRIYIYQGPEYPPGKTRAPAEAGVLNWGVELERQDGVQIDISEWNSPTEKDSAPTRAEPPFTIAELTTIAESDQWQMSISAQAAAHAAPLFIPSTVPTGGSS